MNNKMLKILGITIIVALIFMIIMQVLYLARKRAVADKVAEMAKNQVKAEKELKPEITIISKEEYEQNKDKYDLLEKYKDEDRYLMDENGNYLLDDNGEMIRNTNTLILDEMGL